MLFNSMKMLNYIKDLNKRSCLCIQIQNQTTPLLLFFNSMNILLFYILITYFSSKNNTITTNMNCYNN